MSKHENKLNDAELREVERLVDGELDLAAQQRLLRRLENAPDGWRHCALAFLESQALGRELTPPSPLAGEGPGVRGNAAIDTEVQPTPPPTRRKRNFTPAFALAASFFVAFALGLALRSAVLKRSTPGGGELASPSATQPTTDSMAQAAPERYEQAPAPSPPLPSDSAGADAPIRLVGSDDQAIPAGGKQRSLIPPHVRRALERMGHRVEEHLEMLPIELEDGRQGYVPAERIELHYIGTQYQ